MQIKFDNGIDLPTDNQYSSRKPQTSPVVFRFYKVIEGNPRISSERVEQLLEWIEKFDNSIQCSDTWFDVSAKGLTEYWDCEGDLLLNWKTHGYSKVFDLLTVRLANQVFINDRL